ncbi:MAG: GNAT family N-acetyltransferase [Chitinophagaceae bacterium]|nr:GNAT family N-acetyltransferase [Chitinophagaceae bacterium]
MQTANVTLRILQPDDIDGAMQLSIDAGWNQTANDWRFLIEDSRNICVAAVHDNKITGTTIVLDYVGKLGWIGMVLVDKQYRGKGISKLMLNYVFQHYTAVTKLDATAFGEPVYKQFGFLPEYTIARMVNVMTSGTPVNHSRLLQQASSKHISQITALDKIAFGIERKKLIEYYIQQYPRKAWVLEDNNRLEGFALGRDGYRYHHIGPVVAATPDQAVILIIQALEKLSSQRVVIDVPSDKKEMIQLLQSLGFSEQRRFVRMYKEQNPFTGDTSRLFAIAGPELG